MMPTDEPLLAGLDAGTTSIKASVYDRYGAAVATASVPTPTVYPRPGWGQHDPEALWQAAVSVLCAVTGQVVAAGYRVEQIAGIATASMGEAGVPLDAAGRPTHDMIAWFDRRTQPQVDWLERTFGKDRLFAITGLSLQPIFGLCKLLWLKEHQPEALTRATTWLNVADYFAFRLCGVPATDLSLASRMLALDLRHRIWALDLVNETGLPARLLPPVVPSGTRLGAVLPQAARDTGLSTVTLVAAGGHDHDCGALAAGVINPGDVLDSMGTAEAIFVPLEQPIDDPRLGRQGYSQGVHVVEGRYYVHGGIYTSGACVAWWRDVVSREHDLAALIAEAAAVPPGSLGACFVPHLRLANPPHDDPQARGTFVGLTTDTGRGALFRAVLEGLALESRLSLDALLSYAGVAPLRCLVAIGGGTRNSLLMGIKASVLDQTVAVTDVDEATSLGAAILGGLGAGVYRDAQDAAATLHLGRLNIEPDPAQTQVYEPLYREVYRRIYPAVREIHHLIDAQQRGQPLLD